MARTKPGVAGKTAKAWHFEGAEFWRAVFFKKQRCFQMMREMVNVILLFLQTLHFIVCKVCTGQFSLQSIPQSSYSVAQAILSNTLVVLGLDPSGMSKV